MKERFPEVSSKILEGFESEVREVSDQLAELYGTPHLGNFSDPTAEFLYIVLSRKTPEDAYIEAFRSLLELRSWDKLLHMETGEIENLIYGGGLEGKKAKAIEGGLNRIVKEYGVLEDWGDEDDPEELFKFLTSLPEIGPKSARCIMLYSFGFPVFPVDAHTGRILSRLGICKSLGIDLSEMGHKGWQRALADIIPRDERYRLHVNLVEHGRALCTARSTDCAKCPLKGSCELGQSQQVD